jgi:anti-sigma-K factor RskA
VSHDFRDQAELFVVGALDAREREAFEAHLRACAECAAEVRALGEVTTAMAQAVPQEAPSPQLREKILSAAAAARLPVVPVPVEAHAQARSSVIGPWLAMAASIAVAVALGAYSLSLRNRVIDLEAQLQEAEQRVAESELKMASVVRASAVAESRLAVLTAPDMTRVLLEGQPPAPQASGRAFWSRSRGLLFTASGVPAAPPGKTYQLWLVAANIPISAGLITPDPDGNMTALFPSPDLQPQAVVVAMTLEPQGGVPSPTGDKYLVGLAN